jgi:hypothetical protein
MNIARLRPLTTAPEEPAREAPIYAREQIARRRFFGVADNWDTAHRNLPQ